MWHNANIQNYSEIIKLLQWLLLARLAIISTKGDLPILHRTQGDNAVLFMPDAVTKINFMSLNASESRPALIIAIASVKTEIALLRMSRTLT